MAQVGRVTGMRTVAPLVLALSLAALEAHAGPRKAPPAPEGGVSKADKAVIVAWAMDALADPYSLRSTGISAVTEVKGTAVVCVEFNARNQYGGYEGVQRTTFVVTPSGLIHGSRARAGTDTATCYDPAVVMRPFPELAAIK